MGEGMWRKDERWKDVVGGRNNMSGSGRYSRCVLLSAYMVREAPCRLVRKGHVSHRRSDIMHTDEGRRLPEEYTMRLVIIIGLRKDTLKCLSSALCAICRGTVAPGNSLGKGSRDITKPLVLEHPGHGSRVR